MSINKLINPQLCCTLMINKKRASYLHGSYSFSKVNIRALNALHCWGTDIKKCQHVLCVCADHCLHSINPQTIFT